jgi:hypothetical protein
MKKLFTFFFLLFVGYTQAQVWYFTKSSGTYTPFTGTVNNLAIGTWDDEYIEINLPFTLQLGPVTSTQWFITGYGEIIDDTTNTTSLVIPYSVDMVDRSFFGGNPGQSPIQLQTVGTSPNRISKIEFSNVGLFDGDSSEFVNYQVWIYETSNKIEYHYGPSNFLTPTFAFGGSTGPIVGIANNAAGNGTDDLYILDSIASSPVLVHINDVNNIVEMDDMPLDGMVYIFSKTGNPASAISLNQNQFSVYPNPSNHAVYVSNHSGQQTEYSLYHLTGQWITTTNSSALLHSIDTENLPNGIYWLTLKQDGKITQKKLVVQH